MNRFSLGRFVVGFVAVFALALAAKIAWNAGPSDKTGANIEIAKAFSCGYADGQRHKPTKDCARYRSIAVSNGFKATEP